MSKSLSNNHPENFREQKYIFGKCSSLSPSIIDGDKSGELWKEGHPQMQVKHHI